MFTRIVLIVTAVLLGLLVATVAFTRSGEAPPPSPATTDEVAQQEAAPETTAATTAEAAPAPEPVATEAAPIPEPPAGVQVHPVSAETFAPLPDTDGDGHPGTGSDYDGDGLPGEHSELQFFDGIDNCEIHAARAEATADNLAQSMTGGDDVEAEVQDYYLEYLAAKVEQLGCR